MALNCFAIYLDAPKRKSDATEFEKGKQFQHSLLGHDANEKASCVRESPATRRRLHE
jgi:hypothetical protein